MPCRDDGQAEYELSNSLTRARARNDLLAQMLCAILRKPIFNKSKKVLDEIHPNLADWWKQHQEADQKRIKVELEAEALERKKETALKKLTKAEKELLGLK